MQDEVIELCWDVARIEIHEHSLHLADIGSFRLAGLGDRAGNHVERSAFARGPSSERYSLLQQAAIDFDPHIVRATGNPLTFVDEPAQRRPAFAVAKDHVEEDRDLLGIRLDGERVAQWSRVIEIAPRVERDDVAFAHVGSPQQRSAHAHMRHS